MPNETWNGCTTHKAEEVLQDGGVQLEAGLVEGVCQHRKDLLQDRQEVRLVERVHELRALHTKTLCLCSLQSNQRFDSEQSALS
jgi:hypothetical protein